MIKYHCGFCGCPLDENGEYVSEIPTDYDPDDYDDNVCSHCAMEDESHHHMIVTHEMAMDAQDPSLEGTVW